MSARPWGAVVLTLAVWMGSPREGTAQVADSVSARLMESLRRLDRPPGADTGAVTDSLAVIAFQVASRPGQAQVLSATDSVMAAILGLSGYESTQYHGTAADYDATARLLVIQGDSTKRAGIDRQGTQLTADSVIRYDEKNGLIRAEGLPLFSPAEGDPVQSRRILYDVAAQRGSFIGARTEYSQGATWFVTGDLPSVMPSVVYGEHTDFTSCDLTVPHYHFAADEIKIVAGNILVARPVRLYFADVPVAWLPFFAQSLGTGRASGLLTPRFGVNDIVRTSRGYRRRVSNVGFYWAMSDYTDATLALDWFSGNFTSLTGSFRYNWLRQFLKGSVNLRRYWRDEGGSELAFDTNHDWQMDERTNLRLSARYTSSTDFVRRNSFNPLEVTQSINSMGGIDRRYNWGNLSVSGTRDQYLSDDRVEMTLPALQLNLATITLFRAPALRAKWYNNVTWSGGLQGQRRTTDRSLVVGESITAANRDVRNLTGGARSSLGLGNLSLSQRVSIERSSVLQLPVGSLNSSLGLSPSGRILLPTTATAPAYALDPTQTLADVAQTNVTWGTSIGYQQTLIGSTTFTPSLSVSGRASRSDTIDVARDRFVSAPTRLAFGASLKSDLFGFFPGVGPFEAIRHKLSPGIDFSYSPSVTSNALQARLFGRLAILPRKEIAFSLNQTFEAKRKEAPDDSDAVARSALTRVPAIPNDTAGGFSTGALSTEGLARAPRADIVTLLALRTSAVQYDFVEADSLGFLLGFRTTRIENQISSSLLRGISISMSHDLFADTTVAIPGGGTETKRRFAPRLADVNLGFSLNGRSALFRGFGLFGRADSVTTSTNESEPEEDPALEAAPAIDEASIIPGVYRRSTAVAADRRPNADVGSWSAGFSYSLARPRDVSRSPSQMLSVSFTLKPTTLWDLSWRTSYDLERGGFNDHVIALTRDIHDWQARFDFVQTATGNWAFRFDVSLKANSDFRFDYRQRSTNITDLR
ncbi:MAG TPA: hypothetical protein DIU18_07210 [Gemmatimonadetes bacterium]|nr:hypothetical protein [Gemmatimonadota bacterium]|tara:strand:+ start:2048 stop:4996 length:2949 start_codon:yes stop_codon:yes gene_type:complete